MPLPSNDGPIEDRAIGAAGILDALNDETETIPLPDDKEEQDNEPKTTKTDQESEDKPAKKETIELVEDEQDEKEPELNEDELEIIAPARRAEILKAYPDLFKKFPHLEKAYYRDQKYSELFGTPRDAEQVIETARTFEHFAQAVSQGSTKSVLEGIKQQNPDAFASIVDNYLTDLKSVDEKAFYHVFSNAIKSTAAAMAQEAQNSKNEDLLIAARLMYQYVMGTTNYTGPTKFAKEKPAQEVQQNNELNQERMQFFTERFESAQGDLQGRVDGVLKNTIDQNMDPKGSMTDYVKRVAVNEAMDSVKAQIDKDPGFRRLLDRLWEKAADERFSRGSIEKIRSAYLAKAKTLLPGAIKVSRNAALRGLGKRVRDDDDTETNVRQSSTKRESSSPQTFRGSNKSDNPSKGKSTLDFLNED
jgi:hypothetical protein